jgi:hypothetical protein
MDRTVALSVGLGATAILANPGSLPPGAPVSASGSIPGVDTRYLAGWGLDLPLLVGWRSSAEVVQLWAGARGGYERALGHLAVQLPSASAQEPHFEGYRWMAGGLVGLAIGVKPVWAALELDGSYQYADAKLDLVEGTPSATVAHRAKLDGWVVTPAAALLAQF